MPGRLPSPPRLAKPAPAKAVGVWRDDDEPPAYFEHAPAFLQKLNWVRRMLDNVVHCDGVELVRGKMAVGERPLIDFQIKVSPRNADGFRVGFHSPHPVSYTHLTLPTKA